MTLRVRGNGTKRRRLLILDDEALVLRALARALGREYDVTVLSSPEEALLRLASGDSWDAILSDVMMPEMNGVEFARRAVATRPELAGRLVLMTGGASMPGTCTAPSQAIEHLPPLRTCRVLWADLLERSSPLPCSPAPTAADACGSASWRSWAAG